VITVEGKGKDRSEQERMGKAFNLHAITAEGIGQDGTGGDGTGQDGKGF
jgi:hypothetical protein